MFVASDEATSGSVIAKQERISPARSGSSHRAFCSGVPYRTSTSMLPVSGAEQLNTSGANAGDRPMISQSGAYSTFVRPAPYSLAGQKQIPQTRGCAPLLQLLDDGRRLPAIALGDLPLKQRLVRIDVLVHERRDPAGEIVLRDERSACITRMII